MAGTLYGYPFDEEIFLYEWQNQRDPVLTALLNSGVIVNDAQIETMISKGSNTFTIPYYNDLGGDELNYDGNTDITATAVTADAMSGVVIGRAKAWFKRDFTADFNSGADPMGQIVSRVSKYFDKKRQARLINILNALFGIQDDAKWANHASSIATATTSVTDANLIGLTAANDAMQKALGDSKAAFQIAVMHSNVATRLENLQLLKFWTNNDANGLQRRTRLADYNGLTVVVDDGVPVTDSATAAGQKEYTTYLLGTGVIRYAPAPLVDNKAVEVARDPAKYGGMETLYTRYRETMHPFGFSFDISKEQVTNKTSPTDADLGQSVAWARKYDDKNIAVAKLVTNG